MDKSLSKLDSETTDEFIERLILLEQKEIDYDNNFTLIECKKRKKDKFKAYFRLFGYYLFDDYISDRRDAIID